MTAIRQRQQEDLRNWKAEADKIIHGQRRIDRGTAEALLIGLRHYEDLPTVQQAITIVSACQFKGESEAQQGKALVQRLVVEWRR